jgi:hypothetical protein
LADCATAAQVLFSQNPDSQDNWIHPIANIYAKYPENLQIGGIGVQTEGNFHPPYDEFCPPFGKLSYH